MGAGGASAGRAAPLRTADGAVVTLEGMPLSYLVSYALVLGLAVTTLTLLFRFGLWIGSRGTSSVARRPVATSHPDAGPAPDPAARTFRRCESCTLRWRAAQGDRTSTPVLRVARSWRHLRRALTGATSSRLPASYDRCPRCLSRQVRASRARVRQ